MMLTFVANCTREFSEHKIALLKADGKDVLRVTMSLRQGKEQEEA
jgi:hypothetical protein